MKNFILLDSPTLLDEIEKFKGLSEIDKKQYKNINLLRLNLFFKYCRLHYNPDKIESIDAIEVLKNKMISDLNIRDEEFKLKTTLSLLKLIVKHANMLGVEILDDHIYGPDPQKYKLIVRPQISLTLDESTLEKPVSPPKRVLVSETRKIIKKILFEFLPPGTSKEDKKIISLKAEVALLEATKK